VITHILDSSAVLAHYLREPGSSEVNALFQSSSLMGVCVASYPEIKIRLIELVRDPVEAARAFALYTNELAEPVAVTREAAEAAVYSGSWFVCGCQPSTP
jgi:PIN domain nuclease of toxin-antitoxin system